MTLNAQNVIEGVLIGLGIALLTAICTVLIRFLIERNNQFRVYNWLKRNSTDEPGESHKTLQEIAIGTRMSEDQVSRACRKNKKVYQSVGDSNLYSIWRQEPQSVYEKRGLLTL
jgi:hypothetical protein